LINLKKYIINIFNDFSNECFNNNNILLLLYDCEKALDILKNYYSIIILAIQDIEPFIEYNVKELKKEYIDRFPNNKVIFIDKQI
jgi:hypothetical protein